MNFGSKLGVLTPVDDVFDLKTGKSKSVDAEIGTFDVDGLSVKDGVTTPTQSVRIFFVGGCIIISSASMAPV